MKTLLSICCLLLLFVSISSLKIPPREAPLIQEVGSIHVSANTVSFADEVFPLIQTKCAIHTCHDGSQPPKLVNYKKVRVWLGRIQFRINFEKEPMPPLDAEKQLTQAELDLLNAWIKQGAKNN